MTVELRHLRAFLTIAREGSVTHAAAVLRLTQPTLSRRLAQLEEHLGVRLVDRSTHHLELTPEGRAFEPRVAAALTAVDEALDPSHAEGRPLRLGHAWSALGEWTTPLLRHWHRRHPRTPLELLRYDERTAGLAQGRVDVAVVRGTLPEEAGQWRTRWLWDEPRVAAVPADGALADRPETLTLTDLAGETIALNTVAGVTTLELWPPDIRPPAAATVLVRNTDDWLATIAAGRAVGASTSATAALHAHPEVVYRPLAGTEDVPVLLVRPLTDSHPAVPALVALIGELLAGPPPGTG
ncbi:LysR family transcriptional regulator [Streptomyces oceani]|uniref:LysR family transcriptional regulator n=1 Tax=Streptomyces oceani TaxID=1075402 RepID=A0A1E7KPH7_9ACTN|nr:LysR family transcriptional regulator [Streptomyces oceani]OEV05840.1 LysR family transcriptional regulator [Streptomyces oceani]